MTFDGNTDIVGPGLLPGLERGLERDGRD